MRMAQQADCLWIVLLTAISAAPTYSWAQESAASSKLLQDINQLFREKKPEEAAALVRSKAAAPAPAAEVPGAMFWVAQGLFYQGKDDESLKLLQEMVERFPNEPFASPAWCLMGQVYQKRRDNEAMIAALERGVAARRAWATHNFGDAGNAHDFACQVLGNHYISHGQWAKALQAYTDWKPTSWCGTCHASMLASRINGILLCQAKLGRFADAVEMSWRAVASGNTEVEAMAPLMLVRLYAEAEQLEDLQQLSLQLVGEASKSISAIDPADRARLKTTINASATLLEATDNARLPRAVERELDFIAAATLNSERVTSSTRLHVARWNVLRQQGAAVPRIEERLDRARSNEGPFIELLATMGSPPARDALARLAIKGDIYRQQAVCGLIRYRMQNPQPLIDKIVSGVTPDRGRYTNWNCGPAPFTDRFFEPWTPPQSGSLAKKLPAKLFDAEPAQ